MDRHFIRIRHAYDASKPVKVYRNLHHKCWSIMQNGLVVAHANRIYLRDVQFVVHEKGRQKVIAERKKNVHAFVIGTLCTAADIRGVTGHLSDDSLNYAVAYYNPYKCERFIDKDTSIPLDKADFCDINIEDSDCPVLAIWKQGKLVEA